MHELALVLFCFVQVQ